MRGRRLLFDDVRHGSRTSCLMRIGRSGLVLAALLGGPKALADPPEAIVKILFPGESGPSPNGCLAPPPEDLQPPFEALLGEEFQFVVEFDAAQWPATPQGPVGYGPFIDLYLQHLGADCTAGGGPCDGLSFVKAVAQFTNPSTFPLTPLNSGPGQVFASCAPLPSCVPSPLPAHPFAPAPPPPPIGPGFPPGHELKVLPLPFTSFTATQPPVRVEVTAAVHPFADVGTPLRICAVGGFRYADDPAGAKPATTDKAQCVDVVPTLMKLTKTYLGSEGETATGPNFPRKFEIRVDIANGQTVTNPSVTDCPATNFRFNSYASVPSSNFYFVPPGCMEFVFSGSQTGTLADDDLRITYDGYVDDAFTGGSCRVFSDNDAKAEVQWTPLDVRDSGPVQIISDTTPIDHRLVDKCLAAQKSVAVPLGGPKPGDVLTYKIDFQLTDYKTMGDIVLEDYLSDGQTLLTVPPPQLTISDKFGGGAIAFLPSEYAAFSAPPPTGCKAVEPLLYAFDISSALARLGTHPRHSLGILTGGLAGLPPVQPGGAATGSVTFHAQVDEDFNRAAVADVSVDKDDPLDNCVVIKGTRYTNENSPLIPTNLFQVENDESECPLRIVSGLVSKQIAYINGVSAGAAPLLVKPHDEVTFNVNYPLPASDQEHMTFNDFLPLPVFDVTDPDAVAPPGPPWPTSVPCPGPIPPLPSGKAAEAGTICLSPISATPLLSVQPSDNSLTFDYGTFDDPSSMPRSADLYLTVTATAKPYADRAAFTNEVLECEKNSFGDEFCQTAITQFQLSEPALRIRKGIIAARNSCGPIPQYDPSAQQPCTRDSHYTKDPVPCGMNVTPPGSPGFRFPGSTLTSANIAGFFDSDLTGVDKDDVVTYAVIIENYGSHAAFDVHFRDVLPPGITISDVKNVRITDGAGNQLSCRPSPTPTVGPACEAFLNRPLIFGPAGVFLVDPTSGVGGLAPGLPANANGTNLLVMTFDVKLPTGICQKRTNNAIVDNYAGIERGPNHTQAGFAGPFSDKATVEMACPSLEKEIVSTSETFTPIASAHQADLAIGEQIRYRLRVRLPEGGMTPAQLVETLPPGLFLQTTSSFSRYCFSADVQVPSPFAGTNCGLGVWKSLASLGISAGAPSITLNIPWMNIFYEECEEQYLLVEFDALAMNTPGNNRCDSKPNSFKFSFMPRVAKFETAVPQTSLSNTANSLILEPYIGCTKEQTSFVCSDDGFKFGWRVRCVNSVNCVTDAFEARITDQLWGTQVLTGSPVITTSCSGCTVTDLSATNLVDVRLDALPAGQSATIEFESYDPTGGADGCDPAHPNVVTSEWTSLPGAQGSAPVNGFVAIGAPGTSTGERTSSGGVNDHVSTKQTAAQCCAQAPADLIAWWPLDLGTPGSDGTLTPDIAAHSSGPHDAVEPFTAVTFGPGFVLNAADLPVGSFFNVPGHPVFDFYDSTANLPKNFSIDAWYLPPSSWISARQPVLCTDAAGASGFCFFVDAAKFPTLEIWDQFGTVTCTSSVGLSPFWASFVAVTVDRSSSTGIVVYVDGLPSPTTCDPTSVSGPLRDLAYPFIGLGGQYNSGVPATTTLEGKLDEVEVFDRELSAAEIKAIFDANQCGKCKSRKPCVDRPTGMIAWWPFDANDSANELIGGFDLLGAGAAQPGYVGSGLGLTSGGFVRTAAPAPVLDLPVDPGPFQGDRTIDLWINPQRFTPPTSPVEFHRIVLEDLLVSSPNGYSVYLTSDNHLKLFLRNASGFTTWDTNCVVPPGTWSFVALTIDRSNVNGVEGYLNGVSCGTSTWPATSNDLTTYAGSLSNGSPLYFGSTGSPDAHFNGVMDEVEFFDRLLTPAQIQGLYDAGSAGKCR